MNAERRYIDTAPFTFDIASCDDSMWRRVAGTPLIAPFQGAKTFDRHRPHGVALG